MENRISFKRIQEQEQFYKTIPLNDGRQLGFIVYGAPDGFPVFYFHGSPGSHLEGAALHEQAAKVGVSLICPDRPGHGLSTYQPDRTMLDFPADVITLADSLLITGQFGVMGASGGGPVVLSMAYRYPERLRFAIDLAGAAPVYRDPEAVLTLSKIDQFFAKFGARFPFWLFKMTFAYLGSAIKKVSRPEQFVKLMGEAICPSDLEAMQDEDLFRLIIEDVRTAYLDGAAGPALDARLIYLDWGFDLSAVDFPICIFHGTEDKLVPFSFSEFKEKQLPQVTLNAIPGVGHYHFMTDPAPIFEWIHQILKDKQDEENV